MLDLKGNTMNLKNFFYRFSILLLVIFFTGCFNDKDDKSVTSSTIKSITYKKSFSYDEVNRLVREDLGNGTYIEYTYDDSGNLIKQTVVK